MDKNVLLVLGAGPDQIPGLIKAKEMGIYTIALDGNPHAEGFDYSSEKHVVNIKSLEEVEKFISNEIVRKSIAVNGVIAFGVDIPVIIARAMDLLGINKTVNFDAAVLSEDKFLGKEFLRSHSIPIPEFQIVDNLSDVLNFINKNGYPVVIKPVDNSAARGVFIITDANVDINGLYNTSKSFSRKGSVIIEKYLDGPQISSESFVINSEIYNIGYADRNYSDTQKYYPNIIENGGDLPSIYMDEKYNKELEMIVSKIIDKLSIRNCVVKGDLVIYQDKLYIIEFALRLSGGNFSSIEIPESTGVDFLKIAIQLHTGETISSDELEKTRNTNISIRYLFPDISQRAVIEDISLPENDETIILSKMHAKAGDEISDGSFDHSKRLGFVIARGNSRDEAVKNAQNYLNNVKIILKK